MITARANPRVTRRLRAGALRVLALRRARVETVEVPGAFEVPRAALRFGRGFDGVVAIGCVIRGETRHDEIVAGACAQGLLEVSLRSDVPPIGFGILWAPDEKTALARSRAGAKGKIAHRGEEAARACLRMIDIEAAHE